MLSASSDDPGADPRIPVFILTGFLGAGKTTLLNRVLAASSDISTLVLVNEFGAEGIDHHLIAELPDKHVLLPAGCICCTVRSDLVEALHKAALSRARGDLPPFKRVVLETTGIADPTSIIATLSPPSPVSQWFRLARVITCVGVDLIQSQLRTCEEAAVQIAAADALLLTKLDHSDDELQLATTIDEVTMLNPLALTLGADAAEDLIASLFRDEGRLELSAEAVEHRVGLALRHPGLPERSACAGHAYQSHACVLERPVRWNVFSAWLAVFTQLASDRILRVKAIIHREGTGHPVVVHAVKHVVHPPEELPSYCDPQRRSTVVVIGRQLDAAYLRTIDEALATAQVPETPATRNATGSARVSHSQRI